MNTEPRGARRGGIEQSTIGESDLGQLFLAESSVPDLLHVDNCGLATSAKFPSFGVLDLVVEPWYTRGSMNA
jgi:hypothetical protein